MTLESTHPQPKTPKRKKRIWFAVIVLLLTAIIARLIWSARNFKSIDRQLAEIEATRAIPDSQNAAIIYSKLIQTLDATNLGKGWQEEWTEDKQPTVDALIEASQYDYCRWPIMSAPKGAPRQTDRLLAMQRWAVLLKHAAENDLAAGRVHDAVRKWQCIFQMGNHLRQQPFFTDYLIALAIEAIPLHDARVFVVEGDAAEAHLKLIETMPIHTEDRWPAAFQEIQPIDELVGKKMREQRGPFDRIEYIFSSGSLKNAQEDNADRIGEISRRHLTSSRGLHTLIALRRYKNKHGRWPQNLDQVKSQVPPEALIDPVNNGPFVYMLAADAFELYSTGPNKIDENGIYEYEGGDDWPIWPPYKTKTKQKNTVTQSPDPNKTESK